MSTETMPFDELLTVAYARIKHKTEWHKKELLENALAEARKRGIELDAKGRAELERRANAVLWGLSSGSESRYDWLACQVLMPVMEADPGLKLGEALARLRMRNPLAARAVDLLHQAAQLDAQQFAEDLGCDPSEVDEYIAFADQNGELATSVQNSCRRSRSPELRGAGSAWPMRGATTCCSSKRGCASAANGWAEYRRERRYTLTAAMRYAQAGFKIIPLHNAPQGRCTCGKPDCGSAGKHPRCEHGAHDATADLDVIGKWWGGECRGANIGLVLEGLVAVDVDPRNGGDVDALPHKLPATCLAKTGGGGWHFLFRAPNGVRYPGTLAPGVDCKSGPGVFIVVEPSVHASGGTYSWVDESEPWTMRPAEAPAWLAQARERQASSGNGGAEAKIREGGRNATLTSMGGAMRHRGMSQAAIEAALLAENTARCDPPLAVDEVRRIAASVCRYAQGEQREWPRAANILRPFAAPPLRRTMFPRSSGAMRRRSPGRAASIRPCRSWRASSPRRRWLTTASAFACRAKRTGSKAPGYGAGSSAARARARARAPGRRSGLSWTFTANSWKRGSAIRQTPSRRGPRSFPPTRPLRRCLTG